MHVITGALKNYEWGTLDGLRPWTDGPAPLAELWFGVHPSGPSPVVAGVDEQGGSRASSASSASSASETSNALYLDSVLTRTDVPILVKLLSAAKPLSVQVHPSAEFARRGFHHINREIDSPSAPFADEYEKTELLYALTEFEAFSGWRNFAQVRAIFAALSSITSVEFFPAEATQAEAFAYLVHHAPALANLDSVIAAIPAALENMTDAHSLNAYSLDAHSLDAYSTVIREYPSDPGCLLTLFLAVIHLEPGESIFVPAGVPHSYIRGTGLEVMTSSDNVLRLGLTPKPVFADLALEALSFASPFARAPFAVFTTRDPCVAASGHYRLVLALEGTATVQLSTSSAVIRPGQAAVITAEESEAHIVTEGRVAVVTADDTSTRSSAQ
jgi:mannose-6-phosphate isomerase